MNNIYLWDLYHPLETEHDYEVYHLTDRVAPDPDYHSHDFYEFYFFIAGDASIQIEDSSFRMRPGSIVIFPPGAIHRAFFHNRECFYERMLVYIKRDMLRDMGSREYSLKDIVDERISRGQLCYVLNDKDFKYACQAISELISDTMERTEQYQSLLIKCKLTLFMTWLCKWLEDAKEEAQQTSTNRVAEVIAYINAHLDAPLSLGDIAGHFYLSRFHLMREFKNDTHRTIYQFILTKRVNRAMLLLQSGVSPTDASQQCGFGDYSGLYKAFKKETGLSPKQYVRLLNNGK